MASKIDKNILEVNGKLPSCSATSIFSHLFSMTHRRILYNKALLHQADAGDKGIPRSYRELRSKRTYEILQENDRFTSKQKAELTAKELAKSLGIVPRKPVSDGLKIRIDHSRARDDKDFIVHGSFSPARDKERPWKITKVYVSKRLENEGPSSGDNSNGIPYSAKELARLLPGNVALASCSSLTTAQVRAAVKEYLPPGKLRSRSMQVRIRQLAIGAEEETVKMGGTLANLLKEQDHGAAITYSDSDSYRRQSTKDIP